MARRKNPKISEEHRQKIQTTQLINRLTNFVKGEVEMSSGQVTAALGLLKKSLPDLASTSVDMKAEVTTITDILDDINGTSAGLPSDKS